MEILFGILFVLGVISVLPHKFWVAMSSSFTDDEEKQKI